MSNTLIAFSSNRSTSLQLSSQIQNLFCLETMKEIDVGSLVIDVTRNCKELMSFIAEIWNLDQCSKPFILLILLPPSLERKLSSDCYLI